MHVRRETRIAIGTNTAHTAKATSRGHRPGSTLSRSVSRKATLKKSLKGVWVGELPAQLQCSLVYGVEGRGVVDSLDEVGEAVGDHHHLRLAHASLGHERAADANSARVELRRLVVGNRVPVQRDADRVGDVLHLLAR